MSDGLPDRLELVARRTAFLEHMTGRRCSTRDLVDGLDTSRSTASRALRRLEAAGLVERTADGYTTTLVGRLLAEWYRDAVAGGTDLLGAGAVLEPLPADCGLDPALLVGAETTVADAPTPYESPERVEGVVGEADRLRVMASTVADPRHLTLYREAVAEGAALEMVLAPDLLDGLASQFPGTLAELATGGATVATADVGPFSLLLADEEVVVFVYTAGMALHGVIHNDTPAAVAWAERRFEAARERAEDATGRLAGLERSARVGLPGGAPELPLALREEGFRLVDGDYFERRSPAPPATAWRTGLDIAEVNAGYALARECERDGRRVDLAGDLLERLRGDDGPLALLGPQGSGKSTVCRAVACRWYDAGEGPVVYRSAGGEPFASAALLREYLDRVGGNALVVVEDAVDREANAVFELMQSLSGRGDVSFLLDARESAWHDPAGFPADAGLVAFREDAVTTVRMPPLDERECERLIDHFEATVGRELELPAGELLSAARSGGQHRPGGMVLALHRLSLHADPLAGYDSATPTTLVEDVQRAHRELAAAGPDVLDAGVLVNACNAAGLGDPPALAGALVPEVGEAAVETAVDVLEGRALFAGPDGYRTSHPGWSVTFLEELLGESDAARRFGRGATALLALADEPDRRAAVGRAAGSAGSPLSGVEDWTAWAEDTVERLFGLGREHPGLAPLFGPPGEGSVDLPAACPADIARDCAERRGEMYLDGGRFDAAEAEFRALQEAAADLDGDAATELDARCLANLGKAARRRGEFEAAESYARRALERYRAVGDDRGRGDCLNNLGVAVGARGEHEEAAGYLEEALSVRRELEDRLDVAKTLNNLGIVAAERGDPEAAAERFREALELERAAGPEYRRASTLNNLGRLARLDGRRDEATEHYRRSFRIARDAGDRELQAIALFNIGELALGGGEPGEAREYLERSLAIRRDIGDRHGQAECHRELGRLCRERGELAAAREHLEAAVERYRETGPPSKAVDACGALVDVCEADGDRAAAARLCERGERLAAEADMDDRRAEFERRGAALGS
jgi:tetratricopeptide (TPR) repeat protein/predicted transcriptional regulator